MERYFGASSKIKHRVNIWLSNSTYTQKNWNRYSKKYMFMNVHSHTICKSQKEGTAHTSINRWMYKQIVIYPYEQILFSYKKGMKYYMYIFLDEPWKHKLSERSQQKQCMIPFILNIQTRQSHRDRKQIISCQGMEGWVNEVWLDMGCSSGMIKMFSD